MTLRRLYATNLVNEISRVEGRGQRAGVRGCNTPCAIWLDPVKSLPASGADPIRHRQPFRRERQIFAGSFGSRPAVEGQALDTLRSRHNPLLHPEDFADRAAR